MERARSIQLIFLKKGILRKQNWRIWNELFRISVETSDKLMWTQQSTFMFCLFVSLFNLVNKANLVDNIFLVYVSDDYVPIIQRNKCVYATLGTCYSVWMTLWYARWDPAYQTVIQVPSVT